MSEIKGLEEFIKWADSIADEVEQEAIALVKKTAFQTEADAKKLTPVDTGTLRRSINTKIEPDGLSAEVGTNVEYNFIVEYGTSKQTAQPYMNPAFVKNKEKFIQGMEKIMKKVGD